MILCVWAIEREKSSQSELKLKCQALSYKLAIDLNPSLSLCEVICSPMYSNNDIATWINYRLFPSLFHQVNQQQKIEQPKEEINFVGQNNKINQKKKERTTTKSKGEHTKYNIRLLRASFYLFLTPCGFIILTPLICYTLLARKMHDELKIKQRHADSISILIISSLLSIYWLVVKRSSLFLLDGVYKSNMGGEGRTAYFLS